LKLETILLPNGAGRGRLHPRGRGVSGIRKTTINQLWIRVSYTSAEKAAAPMTATDLNIPILSTPRLILRGTSSRISRRTMRSGSDPVVSAIFHGTPMTREDIWGRLLRTFGMWAAFGYGSWRSRRRKPATISSGRRGEVKRDLDPGLGRHAGSGPGRWPRGVHGRGYATEATRAALAGLMRGWATRACSVSFRRERRHPSAWRRSAASAADGNRTRTNRPVLSSCAVPRRNERTSALGRGSIRCPKCGLWAKLPEFEAPVPSQGAVQIVHTWISSSMRRCWGSKLDDGEPGQARHAAERRRRSTMLAEAGYTVLAVWRQRSGAGFERSRSASIRQVLEESAARAGPRRHSHSRSRKSSCAYTPGVLTCAVFQGTRSMHSVRTGLPPPSLPRCS